MSDSLQDILSNRPVSEPGEFRIIRQFVKDKFGETPELEVRHKSIIIKVSSSALAGALQPHIHELSKLISKDIKLRIQII